MKYAIVLLVVIILGAVFVWGSLQPDVSTVPPTYTGKEAGATSTQPVSVDGQNSPRVEIIAENLSIPWEVVFLPDGELLITERPGQLVLLKQGITIPVSGVRHVGEGGLLGAALHPNFTENNYVYLYQTTEAETGLVNRIVRYTLVGNELLFDRIIADALPGARYHDGGRIAFGPDGYLYATLGDAGNEAAAQDPENLAGSILRYTAEGNIPEDNPFGNAVYSYGHRNPQGLAWDEMGNLWSTEHGRSGVLSGFDELNLIEAGSNYGWPEIQGDETMPGAETPVLHSGPDTTWAPGGLAYSEGTLYFPGLRGQTLYEAVLDGTAVVELKEHLVGEYGRLRTVVVGEDGLLHLTTSNRDGRGNPTTEDDRLIRVNPRLLD